MNTRWGVLFAQRDIREPLPKTLHVFTNILAESRVRVRKGKEQNEEAHTKKRKKKNRKRKKEKKKKEAVKQRPRISVGPYENPFRVKNGQACNPLGKKRYIYP